MAGKLLTKESMCELGLRVKLTHPQDFYEPGPSNPVVGTEWECEGSIIEWYEESDEGLVIEVRWANEYTNIYHLGTLSIVSGGGRCVSIW